MAVSLTRPLRATGGEPALPPLEPGDCLDRATFHARYEAMPEDTRAELIGGVVHMPSPLYLPHGRMHVEIIGWLYLFRAATPGVQAADNVTVFLAEDAEPQPDACLFIDPRLGGQTREQDGYLAGAPELIVEVASSSEAIDMHAKKRDYERAGVREYVAVLLRHPQVVWFVAREGKFQEISPGEDGLLRSEVFPGLWLDAPALLRLDSACVRSALERGLASPEHAAFLRRLASVREGS